MSQLTLTQINEVTTTSTDWKRLCKLGGVVAWVQLACLVVGIGIMLLLGAEPTTAAEYFRVIQNDGLAGYLRLDFATLLMITLFPFIAVALYAAFRQSRPAYALLTLVLLLLGTLLALANHSAFSMIHLSKLYAAAPLAQQPQLLTAGEMVIATDMWHGTAGFLAGIFMQGGFAFISIIMLRSHEFSKGTAYTGLLANGLDFVHVFVMLFAPGLAAVLLSIGGVFYLFWFPLLGRDLWRLGMAQDA